MKTFFFVWVCKKDKENRHTLKGKTEKLNGKCEAKEKYRGEMRGKESFPKVIIITKNSFFNRL